MSMAATIMEHTKQAMIQSAKAGKWVEIWEENGYLDIQLATLSLFKTSKTLQGNRWQFLGEIEGKKWGVILYLNKERLAR